MSQKSITSKFSTLKNFKKLELMLGSLSQETAKYPRLVELSNRCYPCFVDQENDLSQEYDFAWMIKQRDIPCQAYVIALIYIDRACSNSSLLVNDKNSNQLATAAVYLACKYLEQPVLQISGIAELEKQFLIMVEYRLYVEKGEYDQYQKQLNTMFAKELEIFGK